MSDMSYFGAKPPEELAGILRNKAKDWFNLLNQNNYLEKIRRSWMAYHGAYFSDVGSGHSIVFEGEQGETASLPVNHYRNLAQHILVMVTSTRPSFQARSTNTDYKSLSQTTLANGLLDYYMREKRLEKNLKLAVEQAIVLASGYIKMDWNSTTGEVYDYNEATNVPIHPGDVEFTNLSPFDVVFDSTKEYVVHDWVVARSFKNRFDLIAKYPEYKEKILGLSTKTDLTKFKLFQTGFDETDDIPVYEFYHKTTESMAEGRYLLYLDDNIVLMDSPMPYRSLPIVRISPSDILGTPYGYTSMFDILPLQDALNSLYTTVLTNQNAFGVQNIYVPRGADIAISQLAGGLNVIEGNTEKGIPAPLNLTQTPVEIFNFMQIIERNMETISGVNAVARGNPESSLKSGNALALVQSQALQFVSGLQQSYIQMIEDVGTGLITMLRDFAKVPRVAAIVGKSNKTHMKTFTGDDLSDVNRVIVDVGNALAQTTAGRVQIAESMLQMFGDKITPEQYFSVINTGKLETMTESVNNELLLIRDENERLADGRSGVIATAVDSHALHIKEHRNVISDTDLRNDKELAARTLAHIDEHIQLLQTTDPNLLAILGEQPLSPPGGTPLSPETMGESPPAQGNLGQVPGQLATPQAVSTQAGPKSPLPQPAKPAQAPGGAPTIASDVPLTSG